MASADPILTLSDLEAWSRPGTALAVLGHPIKHSVSPAMHNAALAELAQTDPRFADWNYVRFDIHPDDLTVPHKIIAFDRVAAIDPAARPVGAVNTIRWTPAGWQGFNTDGYGLAAAVRETLGRTLAGTPIILLGAGGAARGAAVECLQQGCASLAIANRTQENLDTLLALLAPLAGGIPVRGFAPSAPPADLPAGALVINATSAGLRNTDPLPVALESLPRPAAVFDMIYNPPATALLQSASHLGLPNANGLAMLVHQGARALEIWTGIAAVRLAPAMGNAARAAMGR